MASENQTTLTDDQFIEALWRCAYLSGVLMPAAMPRTATLREWSQLLEDVTAERHRREIANG